MNSLLNINHTKKCLFLFLFVSFFAKAQTLHIGSNTNGKLTIIGNTSIHFDGLKITPSSDFHLSNTKLSKLGSTSNTISSSISKSYYFDSATSNFTGSLKITYQDSELNGETESGLGLVLFSGSAWNNQTIISSDTTSNFFEASVNNKVLSEITLSTYVISSNAAPTDIVLSSNSVDENVTIGTTIGTLSTSDSDSGDTHTYSLVSGTGDTNNTSFSISGVNLLSASSFDYETKTSYSIVVQTSDGTATYSKTFTISVADVDEDSDGDGIANSADNCPTTANADQLDTDTDGTGDVCDSDDDGDGVLDTADAFPLDATETTDTDGDQIGDNTDTDDDNDGFTDSIEVSCGTDPIDSSSSPTDTDADGDPDCLDTDDDNDTYLDTQDAFPLDATEWLDTDGDQIGDNTDTDDDNDNYLDTDEIACESDPLDSSSLPLDYDQDLSPDCIDDNDDDDTCLDTEDNFPLNKDLCVDTDADGVDDRFEIDKDNDGVLDIFDTFPLDPNESVDTDGDGIGNNEDQDDNNDGFSDVGLIISKALTPNETGVESTWKVINIDQYPNTQVRVYAPDGSLVYESNNYQNDWAGSNISNGNPLPTGPYLFNIKSIGVKAKEGWLYIFN